MHGHCLNLWVNVDNGCGFTFGSHGRGNSGGGLSYLPTYIHLNIPLKQVSNIKHGPQKVDPQGYQVMYIELQVLNYINHIVEIGLKSYELTIDPQI
jgi:hypothetical protein